MDPRKFYKQYIPQRHHFDEHQYLKHFGEWLQDPNLWHLSRRSAANAVAVGFFISYIPLPGQVIMAIIVSIIARINLPLTVTAVFLTNPITMGPMFLLAYKVGATILDVPASLTHIELSYSWLSETLVHIWKPLLTGCFILGVFVSAIGNVLVRVLWRIHMVRRWKNRRSRKRV